jgi:hypothetical protein
MDLVNPLAPATRRAPTYRMPPTEEAESDLAPQPMRLPLPNESASPAKPITEQQDEPQWNIGQPAAHSYPTVRASHSDDEGIRQPKHVIRLLGGEPLTAPIPAAE